MSESEPGRIIPVTAMLTEDELARLEAAWRDAMHSRRYVTCPQLPRRVRLHLAAVKRIDRLCGWLAARGHDRAATAIWCACRLW